MLEHLELNMPQPDAPLPPGVRIGCWSLAITAVIMMVHAYDAGARRGMSECLAMLNWFVFTTQFEPTFNRDLFLDPVRPRGFGSLSNGLAGVALLMLLGFLVGLVRSYGP